MKISLITVCFNSEKYIKDTIQSVCSQTYKDLEYIIIDGASNDNTLDIIKTFEENIDILITEKDKGMYDAINKGIKYSTGDIIGLLHSDDVFSSENTIEKIANHFLRDNSDAIYGDLHYVEHNNLNKVVRKWISGSYSRKKLLFGWMPPHPALFIKRNLFKKYGFYDLSFGSAADYELIIRLLFKNNISCSYLPFVTTKMRIGGMSNISIKNRINAHFQDWRSWIKNGITYFPIWVLLKPLRKIPQYF